MHLFIFYILHNIGQNDSRNFTPLLTAAMMIFLAFNNSDWEEQKPALGPVTLLSATALSHLMEIKEKDKNVKFPLNKYRFVFHSLQHFDIKKKPQCPYKDCTDFYKTLQIIHVYTHSNMLEFHYRYGPPRWRILPGSPQPDSVFRTVPKPACRRRSRRRQAVWPAPSKTPQLSGGTAESCSGTDPALLRSSKLKVFDTAKHMRNTSRWTSFLSSFGVWQRITDSWTHPSSVICLLKVVVTESRCRPGRCLAIDDFLRIVPFTFKHLIAEGVPHFYLRSQKDAELFDVAEKWASH